MTRSALIILILLLFQGAMAQWNGWSDAASVRELLIKAQNEKMSFFSQFHIYDARSKGDIYSSKFRNVTNEDLYFYGLDFYYASGTYFDSVYKAKNRENIVKIVKKMWNENRAVPSFSWHLENPYVTSDFGAYMGCRYRKSSKIPDYPAEHQYVIREILNDAKGACGFGRYRGKDNHASAYSSPAEWFEARIKEIADIINEFVDDNGLPIPILFRLWHEMEDNWMWWGKNFVTPSDYKAFYVLTKNKIMEYAPKAQILWAYCPDSYLDSEEKFMERYPGDEYVDIIGYDDYQIAKPENKERELKYARMVSKIASEHRKVAALFETANKNEKTADVFFREFLKPILQDSLVHFGLVQIWSSGKFENESQYQDRRNFLKQDFIIKVK